VSDICTVCGRAMTANCNGAECDQTATQTIADEIDIIQAHTRAIIKLREEIAAELKDWTE